MPTDMQMNYQIYSGKVEIFHLIGSGKSRVYSKYPHGIGPPV